MAVEQGALGQGQQSKDKKSPHLISRRNLLLGGGAAGIIGIANRLGLLPPTKENTPSNNTGSAQVSETPTPDASPTMQLVSPTPVSETPTPAATKVAQKPNPADPDVEREIHDFVKPGEKTPELSPTESVIEKLPYNLHSTLTLSKEHGDLKYFSGITLGVEEDMFSPKACGDQAPANGVCPNVDTIRLNTAAFPDLPEAEARQKAVETLEEVFMMSYLNALKTQDSALYGNYDLNTLKELASKGEAPKLVLPRANTTGYSKGNNIEVDVLKKPLFFIAVGRDRAELNSVLNINYDLRGIDESLILESYKADGYYAGDPIGEQISINKELTRLLVILPDYAAQRLEHEGNGAKISQDRAEDQYDMFEGDTIWNKLVPYRNGNDWRGVLAITTPFHR